MALIVGLLLPLLGVGCQQQESVPELAAWQGRKCHIGKVACKAPLVSPQSARRDYSRSCICAAARSQILLSND